MTISIRTVMGILLIALLIGAILIEGSWAITNSAKSDGKLELSLVQSMEDTKKENEKIFELLGIIPQALNDEGFGQLSLSYSPENREFTVQAKEKAFTPKNKSTIKNIIRNTAKEYDFNNFNVTFLSIDRYKLSEEDIKQSEKIYEVSNLIAEVLGENGYSRSTYSITEDEILIEVIDGKLVNKNEIEERITNSIFSNTNMHFTVTINEQSQNQILDQQWQPIFSAIIEETRKEFKEYRGLAYSFHPEPLQLIIKTNLNSWKWFQNSNKSIDQIEKYVEKIIALKREELSIEEIPYEIIIRDKNDKRIN